MVDNSFDDKDLYHLLYQVETYTMTQDQQDNKNGEFQGFPPIGYDSTLPKKHPGQLLNFHHFI